ncbi:MAG: helix-turn-helix transcriptional regulator [Saprospiraceae bacterium]|nr:helix-turn-helix transcriptional regulator [Saprospiraceae bacterium]
MLTIIGLSISVFIFVILLLKRNKELSDKILTTWLGYISLHIFLYYLHSSGLVFQYPILIGVILPLPVLHSVLLYLYARELTYKDAFTHKAWPLHFLPIVLLFLLLIPFLSLSAAEKEAIFVNDGVGFEWYIMVQLIVFAGIGIGYNLAAYVVVRKYKKEVLNYISNSDEQMLRWLEWLILGLSIIWVVMLLTDGDEWIFICVSAFVCLMGIYGFRQVPVYFMQTDMQPLPGKIIETEAVASPNQDKYQKSGLSSDQAKPLFQRIEERMKADELYKKNDLTLAEIAQILQEPINHLSQAINSQTGSTFYNYINQYRIQAFLNLLDDPQSKQFTNLALAMECGFNSKSTFNKYFKKHTGKTPTEYIKQKKA